MKKFNLEALYDNKYSIQRTFWVLIIGFMISFLIVIFNHFYSMDIERFSSVLEPVTVNLTFKNDVLESDLSICYNDLCLKPNKDKKILYSIFSSDTSKEDFYSGILNDIRIINDKNSKILDNIEGIYLYVGNKSFYYSNNDIKNFDKSTLNIQTSANSFQEFDSLKIKNEYGNNYKGIFNHICCLILFIFYGAKYFIIPYLMLLGAISIKQFKLNHRLILVLILFLGIFLRLNGLNYYSLWPDELYTKTIAIKSFFNCFKDAGNPPLFYIFEYLISKVSLSNTVLRIMPFMFGVISIPLFYLLFKKVDKNLALFASFFVSINVINIYHSQELRSGSLCMFLTILSIYLLFNYINRPNNKNLIYYGISSIFAINTHYYLAIFTFSNFIYAIFRIKKSDKIKFLICNFISGLTFIPYLLISFKKASDATFNTWIGTFDHYKFIYAIREFFSNKYIFLIVLALIIINIGFILLKKNINNDKKELFIYTICSVIVITAIISIISLTIKPIFHKRLCLSLYSILMLLEILLISTVFEFKKFDIRKTIYSAIVFFMFLSVTKPMNLRCIYNISDYLNLISLDNSGCELNGVIIDYIDYLQEYPEIQNKKVIWHLINGNQGQYLTKIDKNMFTKSDKAVIYLNPFSADYKTAVTPLNNSQIIRTNTISVAKIIYDK